MQNPNPKNKHNHTHSAVSERGDVANSLSHGSPDVNAYTNFFRSLALPQLLDRSLKLLYLEQPKSAHDCVRILIEATESNREWYYNFLVYQFEQTVQRLEEQGFSAHGCSSFSLHFSIPLSDGGVFEMFPYGSSVEVSPNNYDSFVAILDLYHQMPHVRSSSKSYIEAATPYLPVSARSHVLGDNYAVILDFVEKELLNAESLWSIRERHTWDALQVTYAVPYHSRLFSVERDISMHTRVPWSAAQSYVNKAREKLQQLARLHNEGVALSSATPDATALPARPLQQQQLQHSTLAATANLEMHSAAATVQPDRSSSAGDNRVAAPHHHQTQHVSSAVYEMGEEEQMFWQHLYDASANPESVPRNRMSFVLQLPHGQISLKENGQFIAVTPQNIIQFVELAEARRYEIHRAFEGPAHEDEVAKQLQQQHVSSDPNAAISVNPKNYNINNNSNLPNKKRPSVATSHSCQSTPTQNVSTYTESYLERYRPELSPVWNSVSLTAEDLNSQFFDRIRMLRDSFVRGNLSEKEVNELQMTFYIPCKAGVYELIPNGRYINVTKQNLQEFFFRFECECERLERLRGKSMATESNGTSNMHRMSSSVTPGSGGTCAAPSHGITGGEPARNSSPHRLIPKPPTSTNSSTHNVTAGGYAKDNMASTSPENNAQGKTPIVSLDESDIQFLTEFEASTLSLLKTEISSQFVTNLNMKWCIVIPEKNFSIALRPNGASITVTPGEFHEYLRAAVQKTREVRHSIAHTGRYPPPDVISQSIRSEYDSMHANAGASLLHNNASSSSTAMANNNNNTNRAQRVSNAINDSSTRLLMREQAEIEKSAKLRETAMPIPPTAAEEALFSPTHNTGGLFAPLQHLNM